MRAHHNTTGEQGSLLALLEEKASHQDSEVLGIFRRTHQPGLTPSQAYHVYSTQRVIAGQPAPPLTSVRRAITNLTKRGLLVRTEVKQTGPYGRPEHVWRLA